MVSKKNKSKSEIENWFNDCSKKGYSPAQLRYALIDNGLEKEANKLTKIHKISSLKKTNLILSLFACIMGVVLLLSLIFILYPGKILFSGYFISEADLPGGALINVNFSNEVGVVREDFYGVNAMGVWGSNLSWIDPEGDGTKNIASDYEWHRDAMQNAGINYLREDMGLERVSISEGVFDTTSMNNNYGNLNTRRNLVEYAKANNIKLLFIADYMPEWLANKSSYCNSTYNWAYCPPSNYTKWGKLVVDFLQAVGCDTNTCEVEVWNEPYEDLFWLNNLSYDHLTKAKEYVKLYNATYDAIKSAYPSMAVGGLSGFPRDAPNLMKAFLSNETTNMDFVSIHPYEDLSGFYISRNTLITDIELLLNNCATYGANCSRIILTEWNVYNSDLLNDSARANEYGAQIGYGYMSLLNKYPENVSSNLFNWAEANSYSDTSIYPGYPYRWSMVSEPLLDNAYYPPYNVTKNFASYHPPGSTVIKSNSSSSNVKVVASKTQYITVINAGASVNIGLNIFGKEVSQIKDLETNEIYNVTDGGVYIGNMSQYQIRYFVTLNNSIPSQEEQDDSDNSNIGGGSGYKIIEEECENISLSGKTCQSLGYASGTLSYGPECTLDTSRCIPYVYDQENTVITINLDEESINNSYEDSKKNGDTKSNQKIFSSSGVILYILVAGILILLFFIAKISIKIRKHNNPEYY